MMMMMTADLYSALRRAPLLRYVSQCIVKRKNNNDDNNNNRLFHLAPESWIDTMNEL